jgi:hypothetical protein
MVKGGAKRHEGVVMYKEILDAIVNMIKANTDLSVVVGGNPTKESIAVSGFASGDVVYMDRDTLQTYDITVNGKSADQALLFDEMSNIHRALTLRKVFPSSQKWQITSIDTSASPRLIGIEDAERTRYLYGSSLTVKFYALGMKGEI